MCGTTPSDDMNGDRDGNEDHGHHAPAPLPRPSSSASLPGAQNRRDPMVLYLQRCRRCGALFDPRFNVKDACVFHGHPLGDRGYYRQFLVLREDAAAHPHASTASPQASRSPWTLQWRWSCCGAAVRDSVGCRMDRHLAWDEEVENNGKAFYDAQHASMRLRTQW
ncbi:hypothetical protein CDCA_CDCA20G4860 [Cyanidium caldarium]|uniref:Uncharacterized protein n=1 Tax=Cyanidium caldarium TaxID=2771 RepID=A0AAV9J2Q0_CYACA|nr:hypothetical protein CDCA_CDCA20G4860 [Cyanidium caldarium]